jgi:hypothetical protein
VPNFGGTISLPGTASAYGFSAVAGGYTGPGTGLTGTGTTFTAGDSLALGGVALGGLVQTNAALAALRLNNGSGLTNLNLVASGGSTNITGGGTWTLNSGTWTYAPTGITTAVQTALDGKLATNGVAQSASNLVSGAQVGTLTITNLTTEGSQTMNGTANLAPNQTASSGSSLMTRDLGDTRYGALGWKIQEKVFDGGANSWTMNDSSGISQAQIVTKDCLINTNADTTLFLLLCSPNSVTATNKYGAARSGASTATQPAVAFVTSSTAHSYADPGFRVSILGRTNSTYIASVFSSTADWSKTRNGSTWFGLWQNWTTTTDQANAGNLTAYCTDSATTTSLYFWVSGTSSMLTSGSTIRVIYRN